MTSVVNVHSRGCSGGGAGGCGGSGDLQDLGDDTQETEPLLANCSVPTVVVIRSQPEDSPVKPCAPAGYDSGSFVPTEVRCEGQEKDVAVRKTEELSDAEYRTYSRLGDEIHDDDAEGGAAKPLLESSHSEGEGRGEADRNEAKNGETCMHCGKKPWKAETPPPSSPPSFDLSSPPSGTPRKNASNHSSPTSPPGPPPTERSPKRPQTVSNTIRPATCPDLGRAHVTSSSATGLTGPTLNGCLKTPVRDAANGARSPSRSGGGGSSTHNLRVQFESPDTSLANSKEDICRDHSGGKETVLLQDGRVVLRDGNEDDPNGNDGSVTTMARVWARLLPDYYATVSPGDTTATVWTRKRRRHLSETSSYSIGSMSSTSCSDSEDETEFERKAPDGGWGWVVVMASFFVHCIADGVTMSFGVLFVEFLDYFQEGKSLTSWIGSLFMAIPLLAGPLASMLTDRYGCRTVTIYGAIVACLGFFVSAFANSILVLLVTVGVITGLGLAVCYVAAIVIVAFYFEKKRSLATGIAVAGSGIGTFLFAPFIQYLIEEWGWRCTLIILAGIFLNMALCGALMRDLEWTKRSRTRSRSRSRTRRKGACGTENYGHRSTADSRSSSDTLPKSSVGANVLPSLDELRRLVQSGDVAALMSPDDAPEVQLRLCNSLLNLPTFLKAHEEFPPDLASCLHSHRNVYEVVSQLYPHLLSSSLSEQLLATITNTPASPVASSPPPSAPPPLTVPSLQEPLQLLSPDKLPGAFEVTPPDDCNTEVATLTLPTPTSLGSSLPSLADGCSNKICMQLGGREDEDETGQEGDDEDEGEDEETCASLTTPMAELGNVVVVGAMRPRAELPSSSKAMRRISGGCMGSTTHLPAAVLRNMKINKQSMMYRGAMLNIHRYRLKASSCPDIYRNSILTLANTRDQTQCPCLDDVRAMVTTCMGGSYCSAASFHIFALSNFILYVFYDTVYMYLTDYAKEDLRVSAESSANLISVIGILNCVGMIVMGYVGDQTWGSPLLLYNISMLLCGLACALMPFIADYWILAGFSGFFGFFISANYALTSVILVELISLEAFSQAYGMLLLIQGVANLIGPPLVGFLADATGAYLVPFLVSGIFIVCCGLLLNLIPLVKHCEGLYASPSSSRGDPASSSSTTPQHNSPFHSIRSKGEKGVEV